MQHPPAPPVSVLVADDDESARRALVRGLAAAWPGLKVIPAVNGVEAWDAFLAHEPALCFLDVRMPGMTGIEVAQRIGSRAQTVFVVAPSDRTLKRFQDDGVLHLTKPIEAARLAEVVGLLQGRMAPEVRDRLPDLQQLLDRLAGQLRRPTRIEVVEAGEGPQARLLKVDDILYFEADARCTRAVAQDGQEAVLRMPLKELAAQLDPERFWQIHRFVVVNQRHILNAQRLDDETMVVSLRERATTLPVARHFQGRFLGH